jgi:hypothetical protein
VLLWLRPPDRRKAQGIVQVSFPQSFLLPRAQEAALNRLGVGLFQELGLNWRQGRTPRRSIAISPLFHVKR